MDLSHRRVVLYHASIERMEACHRCFAHRDYALCAYLSGIAVECVLQANALAHGASHDARHDLNAWLAKCPARLRHQIRSRAAIEWSLLVSMWDNGLRYYSRQGYLGYLRSKRANRNLAGDPQAVLRECTRQIVSAADIIHQKGLNQWASFTKK